MYPEDSALDVIKNAIPSPKGHNGDEMLEKSKTQTSEERKATTDSRE